MKIRKRPVVVDGEKWPGGLTAAEPIIGWVLSDDIPAGQLRHHAEYHEPSDLLCTRDCPDDVEHIAIRTLEGVMAARPGWWIIRGVKGEFYPCAPDVFAQTYEVIGEPDYDRTVLVIAPYKLAFEQWAERQLNTNGEGRAWGNGAGGYAMITGRTRYLYVQDARWARGRSADAGLVLPKSSTRSDYFALVQALQLAVRSGEIDYGSNPT